ncbi:hypothetical protein HK103_002040 [Boothiomyces macroporosus]|uniref:Uncharacterized protein n=1 Tax=Boothiomyces macroporosus TaxID=261099 RepID=A0AAD5UDD1_9FUNG|nr:hypothetical protein HK103_002040 [Boothiomyces macroporosus]
MESKIEALVDFILGIDLADHLKQMSVNPTLPVGYQRKRIIGSLQQPELMGWIVELLSGVNYTQAKKEVFPKIFTAVLVLARLHGFIGEIKEKSEDEVSKFRKSINCS